MILLRRRLKPNSKPNTYNMDGSPTWMGLGITNHEKVFMDHIELIKREIREKTALPKRLFTLIK